MDTARKFLPFVFWCVTFTGFVLVANPVLADIYKCPQSGGLVQFSDQICADGTAEAVALLENSPLDNTAERENIVRYQRRELGSQHKRSKQVPQVLLIKDGDTEERNARITAQEKSKKKSKSKTKRRRKSKIAETTH